MLYHIRHILLRAVVALTLCMATTACNDGDGEDAIAMEDVRVAFTLSVADASSTRAANEGWDDYDHPLPGIEEENMINTDDLYIAICDSWGNIIGDVETIKVIPVSDPSGTMYTITGVWKNAKDYIARAKKIMIVANCNASKLSTISLPDLTYNLDTGIRKYIPMWGVASLPTLTLGTQTDLTEQIYLLRAMAKVRVGMRSDMPSYGYSIGSMHINNYNTKGYCLPDNYKQADRTQDIRFNNSLHVLDSREASIGLSEERATYVPEYDNTSTGATPSTITVDLNRNGKHEGTYTLEFRNYDTDGKPTGTPYDIQRNHYYTFLIYKEDGKIIVSLHVRKWNKRVYDEDIIM